MIDKVVFPETYNCNLACENCNHSTQLKIPIGIMVKKYAETNVCPTCGCMMAGQDSHYVPSRTIPMYLPYGFGGIRWER